MLTKKQSNAYKSGTICLLSTGDSIREIPIFCMIFANLTRSAKTSQSGHLTTVFADCLNVPDYGFSKPSVMGSVTNEFQSARPDSTKYHFMLTGVWISQSWSHPFSCSGWPCSSTLQNKQLDMGKDVLLFLVQHSGIHSHCLFVIHHWHWLSSVHIWRLCYSAEHMKH